MTHPGIKQAVNNIIFALSIILIFLLVFESFLDIPSIVYYIGRFHPVVLHFPIVLLLVAVIYSWLSEKTHLDILISTSVLMALITAISGFLLSLERGNRGELLTWHQWLGISVTFFAVIWKILEDLKAGNRFIIGSVKVLIIITIIVTGHYGGMVTHGKNFLSLALDKKSNRKVIPENPNIYQHLVLPILNDKCASCHNSNKAKGGLILTDYNSMLNGGESGPGFIPDDPEAGELLRRIQLPADHEDHMPPEDKSQMLESEISLMKEWIAQGASNKLLLGELNPNDRLFKITKTIISIPAKDNWNNLPTAPESTIFSLSSIYCTIKRISDGSNALSVSIFPHQEYDPGLILILKTIKDNIVELDLSDLPLGEQEFEFISSCTNMEWLEIDGTPVGDAAIKNLETLKNLRVLKVHNTDISGVSIETLKSFQKLEKLFVWETGLSESALLELRESNPQLEVNAGIENVEFTSILPQPVIQPRKFFFDVPFEISFTHPLNDIDIYYTLDGTDPGPGKSVFTSALTIDKTSQIKYMAAKDGWKSSQVDSVRIYKTTKGPDRFEIVNSPDPKYTGRGDNTLFDLRKGTFNLLDSSWFGFQNTEMLINCEWNSSVRITSVVLSCLVNTDPHIFPPARIEVRGGNNPKDLEMLGFINLTRQNRPAGPQFEYYTCPIKESSVKYLKISAKPLSRLPSWHNAAGSPGWFFVDEMLFENQEI